MNKFKDFFKSILDFLKRSFIPFITILITFFGIIGGIYWFEKTIKEEVYSIMKNEHFKGELISEIHPFIVFDENGSILNDAGGMKFIDDLIIIKEITKYSSTDSAISKIILKPKMILTLAPIIECIDQDHIFSFKSYRGKKFDWIYDVRLNAGDLKKTNRFKLEILK